MRAVSTLILYGGRGDRNDYFGNARRDSKHPRIHSDDLGHGAEPRKEVNRLPHTVGLLTALAVT